MNIEEFKDDYDWRHAFHEASTGGYGGSFDKSEPHIIDNVTEVLYSAAGENDGPEWLAVVAWSGEEGRFAVIAAGCDYTGWD